MNLKTVLESLLFISDHPLSIGDFSRLTNCKKSEIEEALACLCKEYKEKNGGVEIINNGKKYQMTTSRESSEIIQKFLRDETSGELTRPQLETLTVVAYRGPITKAELEQIRGVNCSLVIRNLLIRGLVESEEQKNQEPKYNITLDFLKFLGMKEIKELTDYERLHAHENIEEIINKADLV